MTARTKTCHVNPNSSLLSRVMYGKHAPSLGAEEAKLLSPALRASLATDSIPGIAAKNLRRSDYQEYMSFRDKKQHSRICRAGGTRLGGSQSAHLAQVRVVNAHMPPSGQLRQIRLHFRHSVGGGHAVSIPRVAPEPAQTHPSSHRFLRQSLAAWHPQRSADLIAA